MSDEGAKFQDKREKLKMSSTDISYLPEEMLKRILKLLPYKNLMSAMQ